MTPIPNGDIHLDISDTIAIRDNAPFFGTADDFRDYEEVMKEAISAIKNSTNVRQVVLETWLLVDYAVRELLSSVWGLKQFNSEDGDFDLRYYELLPSFEPCIRLLERVLSIQRALEVDPDAHRVKMPLGFAYFYMKSYPDDFKRFLKIEQDYLREHYPQSATPGPEALLTATTVAAAVVPPQRRYCVNKAWVEALSDLDKAWFRLARRLNKARNVAAHSYDARKILSAFGYAGPKAEDQTKDECKEMLGKLLGIVLKQQE